MTDPSRPTADQLFAAAARYRRAFADLLESLDDTELATPSLCAGWTVRDVGGHLASAITGDLRPFLFGAVKAFGRPHAANRSVAVATGKRPVAELVATIRDHADSRFVPPVVGPRAPLTDVLVHTGDVARPLHRAFDPDAESVGWALDFLTGGRPLGFLPAGGLRGVELVATDLDRRWGSGAPVRGRGVDLLLAACGRRAALADLTGDGVAVLDRRS